MMEFLYWILTFTVLLSVSEINIYDNIMDRLKQQNHSYKIQQSYESNFNRKGLKLVRIKNTYRLK